VAVAGAVSAVVLRVRGWDHETDKSFLFLFFKKESAFFFEKKKQKTFICLVLLVLS
jgi:hypothetical protein